MFVVFLFSPIKLKQESDMSIRFGSATKEIMFFFFVGGTILSLLFPLVFKNTTTLDFLKYGLLNGFAFAVLGYGNGVLAEWLNKFLPWTGNITKRLVVSLISTFIYTSLAWVVIVWIWILVDDGKAMGFSQFISVLPKNKAAFIMTHVITLIVSSIMHGRSFLIEWKKSAIEAEQLKKEHIAAQYETLKNQVNPHFLFNSFNVLTTLVHKDADLAEQFVRQLSDVYRYVLDSRDKEVVPLDLELKELEAYIFLMKIRFGESLKTNISPMTTTEGVSIAPLTLQMLVENALKHNEVSKAYPLSIEVFQEGDYMVMRNNLQLKNNIGESTGVGLENIQSRYRFLTDKAVIINKNDNCFEVKIPVII